MTKQQKQTELAKTIYASGICRAIADFQKRIDAYQQAEIAREQRYTIQQEFNAVRKQVKTLEDQLTHLIQLAKTWEVS